MLTFEAFTDELLATLQVKVPDAPTPNTHLYDEIAIDSLQAFAMIVTIESLADVELTAGDLPEIYTLGDAYGYYLYTAELDQ